jgi:hypothetical protein
VADLRWFPFSLPWGGVGQFYTKRLTWEIFPRYDAFAWELFTRRAAPEILIGKSVVQIRTPFLVSPIVDPTKSIGDKSWEQFT